MARNTNSKWIMLMCLPVFSADLLVYDFKVQIIPHKENVLPRRRKCLTRRRRPAWTRPSSARRRAAGAELWSRAPAVGRRFAAESHDLPQEGNLGLWCSGRLASGRCWCPRPLVPGEQPEEGGRGITKNVQPGASIIDSKAQLKAKGLLGKCMVWIRKTNLAE